MKTLLPPQKSKFETAKQKKRDQYADYFFPNLRVGIIIPAYNEEMNIVDTLERIPTDISNEMEIVVVDDGSVDATCEIAKQNGADVIRHEENKGKGTSLKEGFCYILDKDYDALITMDGDDQHSPEDIPKFINVASDPEIDMVAGNRMTACKNMPFVRWGTNIFTSLITSLISVIFFLLFLFCLASYKMVFPTPPLFFLPCWPSSRQP